MEEKRLIRVGIKTFGPPEVEKCGDCSLVRNMLIGDGFHWQNKIEARLPGITEIFDQGGLKESGLSTSEGQIDAHITLINTLPLETYLECVVGSEMNPNAPIEFLKAHAVISRSWALGKIMHIHHAGDEGRENTCHKLIGWDDTSSHKGFDVCSDDHCQRYQGVQPIPEATRHALKETAGEILTTPDGQPADSRFSKCCGGVTEVFETCWQSTEVGALRSFVDPWCRIDGLSPDTKRRLMGAVLKNYDLSTENYGTFWCRNVRKTDIEKRLKACFGRSVGKIHSLEPLHRGPSGRIDLLRIIGSDDYLDIGKELWIRRLLSDSHLYSSAFEIEDYGSFVKLSGRGWGHGVGLCQIGAANMAFQGKTYDQILSFYYPETSLTNLSHK